MRDESTMDLVNIAKDTVRMAESAMIQAGDIVTKYGDVAIKTDEFNKRLAKLLLFQCVTFCVAFSITAVLIAGIYFIGYSNYPVTERRVEYVGEDCGNGKEDSQKDIPERTQTTETKVMEGYEYAN